MTKFLLDVNVLVALADPTHQHHDLAHLWFSNRGPSKWATCPATVNGAFRVLWRLTAHSGPIMGSHVHDVLGSLLARPGRVKIEGQPEITDTSVFDLSKLRGHNQIPDALLLAIAIQNQARLLTFDQTIPWAAVKGASEKDIRLLTP